MSAGAVSRLSVQEVQAATSRETPTGPGDWIGRHQWRAFSALTLLYLITFFAMSSLKLLWLDELITLHIARLPGIVSIWHALSLGADPNPPLLHILVHFCRSLFGEREFALRLPSALGYWVGLLATFLYLRRRVPATWALAGVMLSMTMVAFDYSYESRSYAIVYGLAMLAFFCWSSCVDVSRTPHQRAWFLVGMTLALAAGISTNYFAVLAFFPVAAGELTLTFRRFQARHTKSIGSGSAIAWRVWLCLACAATPLIAFRSMITHSIAQFAPYAWNKVSMGQVFDSYTQMVDLVLYPILALLLAAVLVQVFAPLCAQCRANLRPRWLGGLAKRAAEAGRPVPWHEAAGIAVLMTYPFVGYLVATIRGGMLSPRFVLAVCAGLAIAGTLAGYRLLGHLRSAGTVLLCLWTAWFAARESFTGYAYRQQKDSFDQVLAHLPEAMASAPPGSALVISEPLLALTFQHYAPLSEARRVVFPVDFPAIRLLRGDDSPEENFWAGRNLIYTLPIVPLATFQRSAGTYLIIASDGNWLVQDLERHRYPVRRLPVDTYAEAIGGFTPLSRAKPVFFVASGDASPVTAARPSPIPFQVEANLPTATLEAAEPSQSSGR